MENKTVLGFSYSNCWDYENGFYLTTPSSRLAKSIAHWEIYKRIAQLPGEIIEFGVFKGASLIRWATYREILESQSSRKLIGFDAFGGFPVSGTAEDVEFINQFETQSGVGIDEKEMDYALKAKGFSNYELIKGNILETLPEYIKKTPQLKIALLHIDVDVYEPAKKILDLLFDKVVTGGIIVLDDYGVVAGETKAVDNFLHSIPEQYSVEKLPFYKVPSFLVK